jgi:hypothetical protein
MDETARTEDDGVTTTRLYGSAIAIVSGLYAIYLSTTGMAMTGSAWFMLALGIVVFVHGALLLTPVARRMGSASGPLMIAYAVLMLAHQAWLAWMRPEPGPMPMDRGMGWDVGMVAIALLMLVSGLIMASAAGDRSRGRM